MGAVDMTDFAAWIRAPGTSDEAAHLPPAEQYGQPYFLIRAAIREGRIRGEQIDHLVWQATVTHAELDALLTETYGPPGAYEAYRAGSLEHLADQMRTVRLFIAKAPADQEFELGVDEF